MDGRRASMTGRGGGVGGGNPGGGSYGGGPSGPGSLDWVVGLKVRVSTILDDVYEGTVFAYDPTTYTVALCHTPVNNGSAAASPVPTMNIIPLADYRILKLSFLKDVQVLAAPPKLPTPGPVNVGPFANAEPKIGPVNLQNVLEREKSAVKLEAERSVTRGVGVTKEAQEIFDGLSRIMPCRWQGKTIVVMDMICVTDPYTPDNVKAGAGQQVNSHALQRVKKVLEGERKRISDSAKKRSLPSTPTPGSNPNANSINSAANTATPVPAVPPVGERKGG